MYIGQTLPFAQTGVFVALYAEPAFSVSVL
jgi:hypothetical protein